MIQPINALTPRVVLRGEHEKSNRRFQKKTSESAVINAIGVSLAAGGITATIARAYTSSWSHAGVLGAFGAFLTMFFMTPHLIEKIGLGKFSNSKSQVESVAKNDMSQKMSVAAKEYLAPAKKLVQTRI